MKEWRQPFWVKNKVLLLNYFHGYWEMFVVYEWKNVDIDRDYELREIVSIDSWLWQFCCKNHFLRSNAYFDNDAVAKKCWYTPSNFQYRLIESSLLKVNELEQFLLCNILI